MSVETATPIRKPDVFEGLDPAVRARTKTMLMYFIVFAIVMLFAGFTSAYIVSNMGAYWVHVTAPTALWVSNALIALSSVTLWWATRANRLGNRSQALSGIALTLLLGIGFTVSQAEGWKALSDMGMGWTINETESGLKAYRWNSIEALLNGPAEYGREYTVSQNNVELLFNPNSKDFYAPNDALMVAPITREVKRTSNAGGAYIWALIGVHILHLIFGFVYLIINGLRLFTGTIHTGDPVRLKALGIYWHFLGILWLYLFGFLFWLY
ncbi:MAG: cytochrome c oxidase subunit 3 [Flavobacteriales bacterium]